jgi:hypothetical protein
VTLRRDDIRQKFPRGLRGKSPVLTHSKALSRPPPDVTATLA